MTGDLVLVKEDNLPPLVWKKAVISDIHAGRDGLTNGTDGKTDVSKLIGACRYFSEKRLK